MVCNASTYPELNFMIGSACNWHCAYCIQGKDRGFDKKKDINAFIDKLLAFLDSRGITGFTRVQYWGGEPLLYFDTIKKLSEALKDFPRHGAYDRLVTNGSLVNDEVIDWIREYNIYTNVSYHDGQLSESQWEEVMKIENITLTGLLHHKRLTLDTFYNHWQHLWNTYGRCTNWCISTIYNTAGIPREFLLTKDDVDQLYDYHKNVVIPNAKVNPFYRQYLNVFFELLIERDDVAPADNYCYNKKIISIDLDGNAYFCHHDCSSASIAGNYFNPLSIHKELPPQADKCFKCKLQPLCHGGCSREITPDLACYMFRRWYNIVLYVREVAPELIYPHLWERLDDAIQN